MPGTERRTIRKLRATADRSRKWPAAGESVRDNSQLVRLLDLTTDDVLARSDRSQSVLGMDEVRRSLVLDDQRPLNGIPGLARCPRHRAVGHEQVSVPTVTAHHGDPFGRDGLQAVD